MLRLLIIGFVVVLIFAVLDDLGLIPEERQAESSLEYRLEHGLERGVDNSGNAYTLGPRHQIIYDDPELDKIQTQLCLSGRIHSSRCGF